jgi:hypothetical protein
LEINSTD